MGKSSFGLGCKGTKKNDAGKVAPLHDGNQRIMNILNTLLFFFLITLYSDPAMKTDPILSTRLLEFLFPVADPFLFCAHHEDRYPAGNGRMGPAASLSGRDIGQDFTLKDGWRMYHGDSIPGFPVHPHRGFETVTIVLKGMVDHSDSHGQAGRYGGGDVQWMTAGSGLQHCEMFPLLRTDGENPAELFQVWLNLPAARKFAEPHYKMLWSEDIPVHREVSADGHATEVKIIAGKLGETMALAPAPDSWAADPRNEVQIWLIRMERGGVFEIPAAGGRVSRHLYFYRGDSVEIGDTVVKTGVDVELDGTVPVTLHSKAGENYLFFLQGRPIGEPVVQYGPFVMNTREEINQAFSDYRATEFGGWPWPRRDMVHPADKGRFATYRDGTEETR
jgi:redox-sensitive bicupin YhaK (pirin superfamily)